MLRLAVDATALFGHRTGVGVFCAEILQRLGQQDGLDVSVFAITWRGRGRLPELLPQGVRASSRRPMAARPLRSAWRRFGWPPIEWWTGPIDVVHGPNFVVPPSRRAAKVVTVHDLTPIRFPHLATRDTRQYGDLLRRAVRDGAHVHAVSSFVGQEVIELLGVHEDKVHVVHNGVSTVEPGDPAGGHRVAGGDRYVLCVGTIEPRKNLPAMVRAFDLVASSDPELRLVVAGPDGWGLAAFESAVARARHRDRVVRLGYVRSHQLADLLAGATVFAYPSLYEGFGLPPLEAMQVGVPVLASTAGALPEVCGDAAVLVPPEDEDALATELDRLLADEQLRVNLATRGKARAAQFTWDRSVAGLREVYEAVCGH